MLDIGEQIFHGARPLVQVFLLRNHFLIVHGKVVYRQTSNRCCCCCCCSAHGCLYYGVRQHDTPVALLDNFGGRLDAVHQILQSRIEIASSKQLKAFLGKV